MKITRKRLKKTLLGNYRAEEVESLLDEAEDLLEQQEQRLQRQEAERAAEAEKVRGELEAARALRAESDELRERAERLREDNARLEEKCRRLGEECRAREDEERRAREETEQLRIELEELRTERDLVNSQTVILGNRVARQQRELEEKDRLLMADPVGEANKRAHAIVQNAMDLSKEMIDDAESMRSRALASVSAVYFNAMSFRQNLEERFAGLQNDLDQSMRTLRSIQMEDAPTIPDYVQKRW